MTDTSSKTVATPMVDVLLAGKDEDKVVRGVPVTIGRISDLFAATPAWSFVDVNLWNITHIPSGYCVSVLERSPEEAASKFTSLILNAGKEKYQRAIRKAMLARRRGRK